MWFNSRQSKYMGSARLVVAVAVAIAAAMPSFAQRTATVSGKYKYYLEGNDDITIRDAKNKAIELAKAEAIKNEFGMLVASDFINMDVVSNDEFSNFYMMESSSSVKGIWLGDLEAPRVNVLVDNDDLCFSAEVKGKAREIIRPNIDLKWDIQKEINGQKITADNFDNGDRFFVKFKSPVDGYVAIYLITGDDETACLLPYRQDNSGRVQIKGGQVYTFFDKKIDSSASYYKLSTDQGAESDMLVLIFSPHPITKCTDTSKDPKMPNVLKSKDFAKWLLNAQRADNDLVVNKKWIKIKGTNSK